MIKNLLFTLFMCGMTSTAMAVDLTATKDLEDVSEALMYMPLIERMDDIRAEIFLSNTPDALAKNSNDMMKLKKVSLDEDKLEVVYDFEVIIPKEMKTESIISDYAQDIKKITTEEDCSSMNFYHANVANHYIIKTADTGNVIADYVTSYGFCRNKVRIPYAH